MLGYLILLFVLVPLIELVLLLKVGELIGVGYTIAVVIVTGVAGASLARLQGLLTLRKIQDEVSRGLMPADKLIDGAVILCSGILLLTPGLITDLIGFMGLIPFTRDLLKRWLTPKLKDAVDQGRVIEAEMKKEREG